jgi:hypothetical protein
MAWTTPRTWGASDVATAAQMNANIRDNFDYLHGNYNPADGTYPAQTGRTVGAWTCSGTNVPYNTFVVPKFDIERYDPMGLVGANWGTITPPAGVYWMAAELFPQLWGQFRVGITRNTGLYYGALASWNGQSGGASPMIQTQMLVKTDGAQNFGVQFYHLSPSTPVNCSGQFHVAGVR